MEVLGATGARVKGQRRPAADSPVGWKALIMLEGLGKSQVGKLFESAWRIFKCIIMLLEQETQSWSGLPARLEKLTLILNKISW